MSRFVFNLLCLPVIAIAMLATTSNALAADAGTTMSNSYATFSSGDMAAFHPSARPQPTTPVTYTPGGRPRPRPDLAVRHQAPSNISSTGKGAMSAHVFKPQQTWTLRGGHFIGKELQRWAKKAKWTVLWPLQYDRLVPADTQFHGTFPDAATQVIQTLANNGVVIHAKKYKNRIFRVTGPNVDQQ